MVNTLYETLLPAEVWRHFGALNEIPRPSGQEEAAINYVRRVAAEHGAVTRSDERGNIVVQIPARTARPDAPTVCIQAHLDMVCEKRPDVIHDFSTDPIVPVRDGNRILASGTTLGADNGIGAAMALAVLTSQDVEHGPLELLFTVEEETGLYGAIHLDPDLLRASLMINLDSEDPEELTVGCAGGAGSTIFVPVERATLEEGWSAHRVSVGGLKGGHSGVQIHEPLANAIKLLVEILAEVQTQVGVRLVSLQGGNAHNAIPRDADAIVVCESGKEGEFLAALRRAGARLNDKWSVDEPGLVVGREDAVLATLPLTASSTQNVLGLLGELPHGVLAMSQDFPGKVETSANLAIASLGEADGELDTHVSVRSFKEGELKEVLTVVAKKGEAAGGRIEERDGYPGWEPDPHSELLETAREAYLRTQNHDPVIQVVHAGLECGVLVAKKPGLEAISFGPLIRGAHTPEEYVDIPSVQASWALLTSLLGLLAQKAT